MSPSAMFRAKAPLRRGPSSRRMGDGRASPSAPRPRRTACASSLALPATRSSWMSRPRFARICPASCRSTPPSIPSSRATSCRSWSRFRRAPIVKLFGGATLIAAISENVVTRRGKPLRLERVGRPEIKNVLMANTTRDPRTKGVELRDLYNREDAFALSVCIDRSTSRASMRTSPSSMRWTASLRGPPRRTGVTLCVTSSSRLPDPGPRTRIRTRWFSRDRTRAHRESAASKCRRALARRRHSRRVAHADREWRAWRAIRRRRRRSHQTRRALSFPYVREPNLRSDLPLPAFLRS